MKKLFIFLLAALAVILHGRKLAVVRYKIKSNKVKGKVRFALLSDLHSHGYGSNHNSDPQHKLICAIKAQNPDVILMAGDIADHIIPHDNTKALLRGLNMYPCFYVSGNHEYKSREIGEIKKFFRELGVRVLEGECAEIVIRRNKINICGVDDAVIGIKKFKQQLRCCYRQTDRSFYTILLAHRPEKTALYEKLGFDLILTGHAHGGQIRLPLVNSGIYAVHQGFFPKYVGGIYDLSKSGNDTPCKMVVSRGLSKSTRGVPRVFNRPEVVIIDVIGG